MGIINHFKDENHVPYDKTFGLSGYSDDSEPAPIFIEDSSNTAKPTQEQQDKILLEIRDLFNQCKGEELGAFLFIRQLQKQFTISKRNHG